VCKPFTTKINLRVTTLAMQYLTHQAAFCGKKNVYAFSALLAAVPLFGKQVSQPSVSPKYHP
jgi:hypothetical protein